MDFKKVSIILGIVIVVLLSTLIYFFYDSDKETNNQDNDTSNLYNEDNSYDTNDYNVVCLPEGVKFYKNFTHDEIKTEIIGEEKRYWQIGEFTPTQKIYKFDESYVDYLDIENMGIINDLDVFSESGEASANNFSDSFSNIEINEKDKKELLKAMVAFEEVFCFMDLHKNDYNKYMTKKLYKKVIEKEDRLDGAYGNEDLLYKTLDEFQNDYAMGKDYNYSCVPIDSNHIILKQIIPYNNITKDDKVFFEKIDNKWIAIETTMLEEIRELFLGPDDFKGDLDE